MNLTIGLVALVGTLVIWSSSPWPIEAQPSGIQPVPASLAVPLQQQKDVQQLVTANGGPDMVLLSSRYNEQRLADEVVGEIMNNGTESAEFVEALATFRDAIGAVVDTATGYADPHLVTAGDSAPFNIIGPLSNAAGERWRLNGGLLREYVR